MSIPRIVIVGGGVAGLLLATSLGRSLGRRGEAEIRLVDRSFTHIWKPALHTLAAGTQSAVHQRVNLLVHARHNAYAFEPGELLGVDRAGRRVHLGPIQDASGRTVVSRRELPYDWLVLALGSGANDFGVPGVREHCHFIDSQYQAEAFNQALRMQMLRAAFDDAQLRVTIVGGGATGVELAAELSHLAEVAAGFGDPAMRERLCLTLFESGPRLLGAFPSKVSGASQQVLEKLGFSVRTATRVVEASAGGFRPADQEAPVPADLMVWAAGVKAPAAMLNLEGLPLNGAQQMLVEDRLHSVQDERVFAMGDCASLTPAGAPRPLPASAQVAHQQAAYLARALPAVLGAGRPKAFVHRDLGALVSLGKYNAYGTLGSAGMFPGHFIQGKLAQMGHAWLHWRHLATVQGVGRAALACAADTLYRHAGSSIRLS